MDIQGLHLASAVAGEPQPAAVEQELQIELALGEQLGREPRLHTQLAHDGALLPERKLLRANAQLALSCAILGQRELTVGAQLSIPIARAEPTNAQPVAVELEPAVHVAERLRQGGQRKRNIVEI